ncbi:ATP-binding protein [Schaedlerella sp.]|uniref:ATP-binding protein n=1 Tax=Schaedlerella sp. TaxID=2676057 RepID=UPI002ED2165B
MAKKFNIAGLCLPEYHYMVDISDKVEEIMSYIEAGEYFTMNRARKYGKTTTLEALKERLQKEYTVFSISFEGLTSETFASENTFCTRFFSLLYDSIEFDGAENIPDETKEELSRLSTDESGKIDFHMMAGMITKICRESPRPVVLMIDEIDQASNNEIFAAFLGQLRVLYLKRNKRQTFRSVILAGVRDIKNLKVKICSEKDHEKNSPWNIAADFDVEMRLSEHGIAGMLENYEQDYHTGMDIKTLAGLIYDYTSGYPFLVSRICKLLDEKIAGSEPFPARRDAWPKEGFLAAIRILLAEKNTLFESLTGKLQDYLELKEMIFEILFSEKSVPFRPLNPVIGMASMFGFIKNQDGNVAIANRIFETVLYNLYLSLEEIQKNDIYSASAREKKQFIIGGHLNMRLVLERFVEHFNDLYAGSGEKFVEESGRKLFLLYLQPIINGTGNYYIESRTRNMGRTDIIVDYHGEQHIIEAKIWRGQEYNRRGESQLTGYLEDYHIESGYMLSFNFNKKSRLG